MEDVTDNQGEFIGLEETQVELIGGLMYIGGDFASASITIR